MKGNPRSAAAAYQWKSAMENGDVPELSNVEMYRLPEPESDSEDGDVRRRTIYKGDRFWDTNNRYLITVETVKTKIYQGIVAGQGKEGGDSVFFSTDHNPPDFSGGFTKSRNPHTADEPFFMRAEEFAKLVAEGDLVPHNGNGVVVPP